jgi:hypothetical protein
LPLPARPCPSAGIAYEPEPWELARQQRLERCIRQRDQIAGIVVYHDEWNEAAEKQVAEDAWLQATAESQTEGFPDDFDQRLPEDQPVFFTD